MDNVPSRLASLKELVGLLTVGVQVQKEIADILSDYEKRIYALEEDSRRILACNRAYEQKISSLEKRYAELLFKLSEFKN